MERRDVRIGGSVKGTGIAIGAKAKAIVGLKDGGDASAAAGKPQSWLLISAGIVFMLAAIASGVLLAFGVVDLAVAGFIVAALAVGVAAVPLLRG